MALTWLIVFIWFRLLASAIPELCRMSLTWVFYVCVFKVSSSFGTCLSPFYGDYKELVMKGICFAQGMHTSSLGTGSACWQHRQNVCCTNDVPFGPERTSWLGNWGSSRWAQTVLSLRNWRGPFSANTWTSTWSKYSKSKSHKVWITPDHTLSLLRKLAPRQTVAPVGHLLWAVVIGTVPLAVRVSGYCSVRFIKWQVKSLDSLFIAHITIPFEGDLEEKKGENKPGSKIVPWCNA